MTASPVATPPITTTDALAAFCRDQAGGAYIAVDTEFVRETTYWPKLCLVQVAGESGSAAIDTLADGVDLAPLFELMSKPDLLKVFHAARQDLEIFYYLTGSVPAPLFDTQVAAMVCGFGDQVGYEVLVRKLTGAAIDKSSRFTDWARRPLNDRQIAYALADVVHLRPAYEKLAKQLERSGRSHWLAEEMAVLADPATYRTEPEDAWRRMKTRGLKPRQLAVLQKLAAWREREAQRRDMPRSRILRDDAMMNIAATAPRNAEELGQIRGLSRGAAQGQTGAAILQAVQDALAVPKDRLPEARRREAPPPGVGPISDLLKVLLKARSEEYGIASRLVATADDLEKVAADDNADVPALKGWRRELFGEAALALKHGRLALAVGDNTVRLVALE